MSSKKKTSKSLAKKPEKKKLPAPDPVKQKELKRLEGIVEKGWDTFIEVGRALVQIDDEELYRYSPGSARSFSGYLLSRWGNRTTGYRHINAYKVHTLLLDSGVEDPSSSLHTEAEYLKLANKINLADEEDAKGKLPVAEFKEKVEKLAKGSGKLDYGKLKKAVGIPPKDPVVREATLSKEERIASFRKKLLAQIDAKIKAWKAKDMSVSLDDIVKGLR